MYGDMDVMSETIKYIEETGKILHNISFKDISRDLTSMTRETKQK